VIVIAVVIVVAVVIVAASVAALDPARASLCALLPALWLALDPLFVHK